MKHIIYSEKKHDPDMFEELMTRVTKNHGRAVLVIREDAREPLKECVVYSSFGTADKLGIQSAILTLVAGIAKLFNSVDL